MNVIDVFQKCLVYACLAGAAVCFLVVLAYHFRDQLRELHERWLGLGPLGRVVSILAVTLAVLYGGTKSPTNEVTGTGATGTGATGVSPVAEGTDVRSTGATGVSPVAGWGPDGQDARRPSVSADGQDARWPSALRPMARQMAISPQLTNQPTNQLTNWTARGAYSDWHHIDFPSSFAFPHGTNLLTSITLFAYGEIRESLHQLTTNNQQLTTLPTAVSLSPGESSVTYGLTPSNSFLIAWQNACVNRDASNRVDASIELFRNGAIVITTQRPGEAPTTNYQPPTTPPGFFGSDQDNAWALAAFPDDYDVITNKGYEAWLMEDKVGINEPNGLYKATITVGSLPDEGPCYLVCGPYKVVVTSPGSYSFPLEVFVHYEARTYPTAVPISVEYDDGYRGDGDNMMSSQNHAPLRLGSVPVILPVYLPASFYAWPSQIQLSQARNAVINLWCNLSLSVECVWHSRSSSTLIGFLPPSMAEIRAVFEADDIEFVKRTPKGEARCVVSVIPDHNECCCGSCTGIGCSCGCACHHHESGGSETNGVPSSGTQQ